MTLSPAPDSADEHRLDVLVLAPVGRDATLIVDALHDAGLTARAMADIEQVVAALDDAAGVAVLAEEAVGPAAAAALTAFRRREPAWSDVPFVILRRVGAGPVSLSRPLSDLSAETSVTLLERPVHNRTLLSTINAALRDRQRQYELRGHLAELERVVEALGVSERRERAARVAADSANRAKTEFLTTMSHELRTPLNAIAGYCELLEMGLRGPLTELQAEDIRRVRRSGEHLLRLVNDILNLAKIESGRLDLECARLPLIDVLRRASEVIEPIAKAKGVDFVWYPCGNSLAVWADEEKLHQVVLNVLSNAVKFTDTGGLVTVDCVTDAAIAYLRVADTGRGIAPDELGRVFERFVQVGRNLRRTGEGSGLGLAISRDLIRAMGGDIAAKSAVGQGSTFSIAVPRERTAAQTMPRADVADVSVRVTPASPTPHGTDSVRDRAP